MINRREFIKLGLVASAGILAKGKPRLNSPGVATGLVRVGSHEVSVYSMPSDESTILYQHYRDDVIHTYYPVTSEYPPDFNRRWYRVWGGYIHSAHLQPVRYRSNPLVTTFPKQGFLAEITVPYTQTMWKDARGNWEKMYRLYYQSTHWVTGVEVGPDGDPWYVVKDELLDNTQYYARTEDLRIISPDEYSPLAIDRDEYQKRIEVSIPTQTLTAYEGDNLIFKTRISSGLAGSSTPDGGISTDTPRGEFHIESKMPSKHMGSGELTSDYEAYVLPGVPWTSFFVPETGVAFHGTYWHDNYGVPMSHGCVNMRPSEALWLFRWSTPIFLGDKMEERGYGTRVLVY